LHFNSLVWIVWIAIDPQRSNAMFILHLFSLFVLFFRYAPCVSCLPFFEPSWPPQTPDALRPSCVLLSSYGHVFFQCVDSLAFAVHRPSLSPSYYSVGISRCHPVSWRRLVVRLVSCSRATFGPFSPLPFFPHCRFFASIGGCLYHV